MQHDKQDTEMVERRDSGDAASMPVMRSKFDDLSVWQSVRRYKQVGLIAMAAAFCASLDGYRKYSAASATNLR